MQHFNIKLKINGKPNSWYNIFANIYEMPTSSYDGYVKAISIADSDTVELNCYLVDDLKKIMKWKELYSNSWKDQRLKAINNAIINHSKTEKYIINDIVIQELP